MGRENFLLLNVPSLYIIKNTVLSSTTVFFLKVDLTKKGHVTGISTQGFYGEEQRFVTEYLVQYSDDADLWREHSVVSKVHSFN